MEISIIVAIDEKGGIGIKNRLPWRLSADLNRFKTLTMGHHVLMGRNTYLSLTKNSSGGTLPGRQIIVVSEKEFHPQLTIPQVVWVSTIEDGINQTQLRQETELFISGGAQIYAQCISFTRRLYLTRVHTICEADAFFPEIEPLQWTLKESVDHPADDKNEYSFTFQVLERTIR